MNPTGVRNACRRTRIAALVVCASGCLALTIGCARGAPNTLEYSAANDAAVVEELADGSPVGAATPAPPSGYPLLQVDPHGQSGGESESGGWPAAEAYPGGRRPTPVPAAERAATRVAAQATTSAARDSMSAAITEVLPDGATFDLDELDDWSGALGHLGRGLPIRLRDGSLDYVALMAAYPGNVAAGLEEPNARLVWRMTETVPVNLVTAIRETGLTWPDHDARGLQVDMGGTSWLVVVAFTEEPGGPEVQDAFALPGVLAASRESERPQHGLLDWESDVSGLLVGSVISDRKDDSEQRSLTVHGAPFDGVAPLVAALGPDASVQDVDGDGSPEIVAAAGDGSHDVWRLAEDGLVADGHLPEEEVAAPANVRNGNLPPIPADLYFYRVGGEGEVWRWPATGGAIERSWPMPDVTTEPGPELRIAAPRSDEAIVAGRPPYQVARDAPVVVYSLADREDPSHAVALGFQNLEENTWHEVPITGTLGSWSVAPDGRSALYLGRGALSGVSRSYAAGDAGLFHVAPGGVDETRLVARCESVSPGAPYGSLRCTSFAPDASWSNVAYGDGHGVWVVPMAGGAPQRVLDHQLAETEAGIFDTHVYRPVQWSPDGNWLYLLAGRYEGETGSLLNLESGGVIDLDAAGQGHESGSTVDFAPDSSRVGVTRFGYGETAAVSLLDLASMATRAFLSSLPVTGRNNGASGAFTPEGQFRFGSWSPWQDRYQADGVFELDPQTGMVRRLAYGLASLDPGLVAGSNPPDLVWSPDAEAFALAGTTSGKEWYAGALVGTEAATYDAREILAGAGFLQWSRDGR